MVPRTHGRHLHARHTDPASSQRALQRVEADLDSYMRVLDLAARSYDQGHPFSDGWLGRELHIPRNWAARIRLEVERDGWLEREQEPRATPSGPVLVFNMLPAYRALWSMVDDIAFDYEI